jgi:hypothetical protein
MADAKLSALTELAATPAVDDELYIRDISEAAADESKRITVANLIAALHTGRGATYVIAASDAPAHVKAQADYVCDGTADNVEIQAAITALTGGRTSNQKVKLSGSFTIAATITVPAYTDLDLTEARITLADTSNCDMILINGSFGNVTGGILEGNKANQASGNGISITSGTAEEIRLQDIIVNNAFGHGFYFNNFYGADLGENLRASGCGGSGFYNNGIGGVTLTNCWAVLNGVNGLFSSGTYCVYERMVCDQNVDNGIRIQGGGYTVVNSFVSTANGEYDLFVTAATQNIYSNGALYYKEATTKTVNTAANLSFYDCTGCVFSNITMTNRPIDDTVGYGVKLTEYNNNYNNILSGCTIDSESGDLQFVEAQSGTLTGNNIRDNQLLGLVKIYYSSTASRVYTERNNIFINNTGYIVPGEIRTASGALVPTGTCTATTVSGTFTESPLALKPGANTMTCTASGTINVVMPAGSTAVVTSGDSIVTSSPKTCPAGATTLVTVTTGAGADTFTITVHSNAFAWHNPEAQDILIKKIVINRSAAGGTATAEMNVGIADNGTVDNPGVEFFDSILVNNAAAIHDSYVAGGTSYGTQTIWVNCQDSVSATDGWVVGKIDTEIANALAGSYYIEYTGK